MSSRTAAADAGSCHSLTTDNTRTTTTESRRQETSHAHGRRHRECDRSNSRLVPTSSKPRAMNHIVLLQNRCHVVADGAGVATIRRASPRGTWADTRLGRSDAPHHPSGVGRRVQFRSTRTPMGGGLVDFVRTFGRWRHLCLRGPPTRGPGNRGDLVLVLMHPSSPRWAAPSHAVANARASDPAAPTLSTSWAQTPRYRPFRDGTQRHATASLIRLRKRRNPWNCSGSRANPRVSRRAPPTGFEPVPPP